jgi:hypothetical protein
MQSLYRRGAKRFSVAGVLFMLVVGVPLVYAGVNDFASQTNGTVWVPSTTCEAARSAIRTRSPARVARSTSFWWAGPMTRPL